MLPVLRISALASLLAVAVPGCGGAPAPEDEGATTDAALASTASRGFPALGPWVSFYGAADDLGDLGALARRFRVINIDADPADGDPNFTPAQIAFLKQGGANKVISYLDLGSCERFRTYWSKVPSGFVGCAANVKAHLGAYDGYPDEVWMNLGDPDYQKLILEYVAPRLVATGVDGFFLDNLELLEHGTDTRNGPCDRRCVQGGLDLVETLRRWFPGMLLVMQNATSDVTRLGKTTRGVLFRTLLDGISHESVFAPGYDGDAHAELSAWRSLNLRPGNRAFFIGTEDYVGSCQAAAVAKAAYTRSRSAGFSPYATDASDGQRVVCYWPF